MKNPIAKIKERRLEIKAELWIKDWRDKYRAAHEIYEALEYRIQDAVVNRIAGEIVESIEPEIKEKLKKELLSKNAIQSTLDSHYKAKIAEFLDK